MRALGYLRVSSLSQTDGDGFDRQRAAIADYAERSGIEVVAFYEDAMSGTVDWGARKGLRELLEHAEHEKIQLVLVEEAHRLARDLIVSEHILDELTGRGIQVIAAQSGTDLTVLDGDETRILIRHILSAVAQYQKTHTVRKLRVARQRAGDNGGKRAFGYYDGEAYTLRRMEDMMALGCTLQEVADRLTAEELHNRAGQPFSKKTIARILRANGWSLHYKPRRRWRKDPGAKE